MSTLWRRCLPSSRTDQPKKGDALRVRHHRIEVTGPVILKVVLLARQCLIPVAIRQILEVDLRQHLEVPKPPRYKQQGKKRKRRRRRRRRRRRKKKRRRGGKGAHDNEEEGRPGQSSGTDVWHIPIPFLLLLLVFLSFFLSFFLSVCLSSLLFFLTLLLPGGFSCSPHHKHSLVLSFGSNRGEGAD